MKMLERFYCWVHGFSFFRRRFKYRLVGDIPVRYAKNMIYIVGEANEWLITMRCPCGCRRIINLNTLQEAKPCWIYQVEKRKISLQPSIWGTDGCRSHFIIKNGSIEWVGKVRS
ncbi:DUF6527 family protein [Mucilaginibacter celer]|uniref:Uncharacterized protein n=1 Tax=Mucilaginibacter celer TaxID=2305508 RepID=A0A494VR75_9SPHI|nr:DUF6527 family protein [Mucilaginibacter celer]AYL96531.1 hypothetical protein HYN43_015025 [Mucilaginibacter celer]